MPNFLTEKMGPLPVWGWMIAGAGGLLAVSAYSKKKQAKQQNDQVQQQAQIAAAQAASTAAAAPYQPYTVPYITSSNSYGNGYSSQPDQNFQNQPGGLPPGGGGPHGPGAPPDMNKVIYGTVYGW